MKNIYDEALLKSRCFNERIESEFFKVIKNLSLPLDNEEIKQAGVIVERSYTEIFMEDKKYPISRMDLTAKITQFGKPISRTISMDESTVDSSCIDEDLRKKLISNGVLCEVLDDLKRMNDNTTKTLKELLKEPTQPAFNCTEITLDPKTHKINRVVVFGTEYN